MIAALGDHAVGSAGSRGEITMAVEVVVRQRRVIGAGGEGDERGVFAVGDGGSFRRQDALVALRHLLMVKVISHRRLAARREGPVSGGDGESGGLL